MLLTAKTVMNGLRYRWPNENYIVDVLERNNMMDSKRSNTIGIGFPMIHPRMLANLYFTVGSGLKPEHRLVLTV